MKTIFQITNMHMYVHAHVPVHVHKHTCAHTHIQLSSSLFLPLLLFFCFCQCFSTTFHLDITLPNCLCTVPFKCTDVCTVGSQRRERIGKSKKTIITIVLYVMFRSLICTNFVWNIFQVTEY